MLAITFKNPLTGNEFFYDENLNQEILNLLKEYTGEFENLKTVIHSTHRDLVKQEKAKLKNKLNTYSKEDQDKLNDIFQTLHKELRLSLGEFFANTDHVYKAAQTNNPTAFKAALKNYILSYGDYRDSFQQILNFNKNANVILNNDGITFNPLTGKEYFNDSVNPDFIESLKELKTEISKAEVKALQIFALAQKNDENKLAESDENIVSFVQKFRTQADKFANTLNQLKSISDDFLQGNAYEFQFEMAKHNFEKETKALFALENVIPKQDPFKTFVSVINNPNVKAGEGFVINPLNGEKIATSNANAKGLRQVTSQYNKLLRVLKSWDENSKKHGLHKLRSNNETLVKYNKLWNTVNNLWDTMADEATKHIQKDLNNAVVYQNSNIKFRKQATQEFKKLFNRRFKVTPDAVNTVQNNRFAETVPQSNAPVRKLMAFIDNPNTVARDGYVINPLNGDFILKSNTNAKALRQVASVHRKLTKALKMWDTRAENLGLGTLPLGDAVNKYNQAWGRLNKHWDTMADEATKHIQKDVNNAHVYAKSYKTFLGNLKKETKAFTVAFKK